MTNKTSVIDLKRGDIIEFLDGNLTYFECFAAGGMVVSADPVDATTKFRADPQKVYKAYKPYAIWGVEKLKK